MYYVLSEEEFEGFVSRDSYERLQEIHIETSKTLVTYLEIIGDLPSEQRQFIYSEYRKACHKRNELAQNSPKNNQQGK